MPNFPPYFLASQTIDNSIVDLLAKPGDTLVLGARRCSIAALPGDFNYIILADKLSLAGIPSVIVQGTAKNPSPNITVLAVEIDGAFDLSSHPLAGVAGNNGDDANPGKRIGNTWIEPATPAEKGGDGTDGSPGGSVTIHYCNAAQLPVAAAPGGLPGPAGHGGKPNAPDGSPGQPGDPGHAEVQQVSLSELWNPLDTETLVRWAEFRGASITIWNRIEPRSRVQDFTPGLEARLFDPLWLLARQWQIGEYAGRDAGSPIAVDVISTARTFDRYAAGAGTGQAYHAGMPLEVLVEREAVRPGQAANDLRQAAEAGLHFGRLLDAAGLSRLRAAYLAKYPLSAPTSQSGRLGPVVAGRVIDGVALHADLSAVPNGLPPKPVIAATDVPLLLPVAKAWLLWYDTLFSEPSQDHTWSQDRMEYSFSMGAVGDPGSFVASEYDGGAIDWHTFDKTSAALTGTSPQPSSATIRVLPSPVSFRGMPARRYWEFEDGTVDIGALSAAAEDLGRLLLREFALIYATDWFLIPLRVPAGSVTSIDSFKVSDTFGLITTVPHYSVADGPAGPWHMFRTSGIAKTPPDNRLLILPSAVAILDGEPVEDVLLLRDELADLVWGVERSALGPEGVPIDRGLLWRTTAPPIPPPVVGGPPRYRLGSMVPDYWIPFLPASINGSLRFQRGKLPAPANSAPLGAFLSTPNLTLYPEEVPREGVHLKRRFRLTRGVKGDVCLWMARERTTGLGEGQSGLRFDYLEF